MAKLESDNDPRLNLKDMAYIGLLALGVIILPIGIIEFSSAADAARDCIRSSFPDLACLSEIAPVLIQGLTIMSGGAAAILKGANHLKNSKK